MSTESSVVGEVTAGLAEGSGSLPPGLWLRSHLQADCRGPGSVPDFYDRFKYWTTLNQLYLTLLLFITHKMQHKKHTSHKYSIQVKQTKRINAISG